MPKPYQAKSGAAIAPDADDADRGAAAQQRVVRTAAGAAPITKPPGAMASVFDTGWHAPPPARVRLAVPPAADLVVDEGAAFVTPQFGRQGTSRWTPILALLAKPNTSVALPLACRNPLVAHLRTAKLAGRLQGTFVVGLDAKDPTKCRLVRTA